MAQTTISPELSPTLDRHRHPMRPLNLVCISRDGLLHSERRITSAHGMILVGDRRAEEGHNSVAHNPVHGAFVAVDCLDHAFEHRVEELLRILRVAVSKQLHRALDIGEQHGDLLPLTLEGRLGGEDLIGKMLRRIILGRGKAGIVPNGGLGDGRIGGRTWLWTTLRFHSWHRLVASGAAHSSQNFASAVFSCWHFGHFIAGPGGRSEPDALRE